MADPKYAFTEDEIRAGYDRLQAKHPDAWVVVDNRTGAIAKDRDGNEVAHDIDRSIPPASLAKIMTTTMAYEAVKSGKLSIDESLDITGHDIERGLQFAGGTLRNDDPDQMKPEQIDRTPYTITMRDALKGAVIDSANDLAIGLGKKLAQIEHRDEQIANGADPRDVTPLSEEQAKAKFTGMMNRKAQSLGMRNTTFLDPSGLPQEAAGHTTESIYKDAIDPQYRRDHTTTARDMATLARYNRQETADDPVAKDIFESTRFSHPEMTNRFLGDKSDKSRGKSSNLEVPAEKNAYSKDLDGLKVLKTGYLNPSGSNAMGTLQRDGKDLTWVHLGGEFQEDRDRQIIGHLQQAAGDDFAKDFDASQIGPQSRKRVEKVLTTERDAAAKAREIAPQKPVGLPLQMLEDVKACGDKLQGCTTNGDHNPLPPAAARSDQKKEEGKGTGPAR